MTRPTAWIAVFAAALTLAVAPRARAADYSLVGGAVKFSAPDAWTMLIEKLDGNRQFVGLQVPDPGASDTLARITVTVERVNGVQGFQQFLTAGTERARKLPGYTAASSPGTSSSMRYTATENGHKNLYGEHYLYRANLGIQVRCIRPEDASADWSATFDAGCQSIVNAVQH